jgi:cell division protein FtsB
VFTVNDIVSFFYAIKDIDNPIAWIIPVVLVAFLAWRKFTTTEYVTAGKAAFDALNKVCDQLQEENEILKKEIESIKKQLKHCKKIIKELTN